MVKFEKELLEIGAKISRHRNGDWWVFTMDYATLAVNKSKKKAVAEAYEKIRKWGKSKAKIDGGKS
jgi:endo-alpha-1,4-polygalactosaminidase (GH114 family)